MDVTPCGPALHGSPAAPARARPVGLAGGGCVVDADPMDLRRAWPAIGLAALLVLDLALVVWALWPSALRVSSTHSTPDLPRLDRHLLVGVGATAKPRVRGGGQP